MIMHYRVSSQRPGITLLEVLTAIFIMGIGMLAVLTLFPAGALSMAKAIRDDRAATIAGNSAALAASVDLANDPAVVAAVASNTSIVPLMDINGQSNPVFVD